VETFTNDKISKWISEVDTLSSIATTQPHAAYTCFTHGLLAVGCTYCALFQTHLQVSSYLREHCWRSLYQPWLVLILQQLFNVHFLPLQQGLVVWVLLDLMLYYRLSFLLQCMSLHLYDLLFYYSYTADIRCSLYTCKLEIKQTKSKNLSAISTELLPKLTLSLQKAVTLAQEKGASSWLTALPVAEHGFSLHKTAFLDALALRYGWMPICAPFHCTCGTSFSVDHALSCSKGGFPSIRHSEVRDLTAIIWSVPCCWDWASSATP